MISRPPPGSTFDALASLLTRHGGTLFNEEKQHVINLTKTAVVEVYSKKLSRINRPARLTSPRSFNAFIENTTWTSLNIPLVTHYGIKPSQNEFPRKMTKNLTYMNQWRYKLIIHVVKIS